MCTAASTVARSRSYALLAWGVRCGRHRCAQSAKGVVEGRRKESFLALDVVVDG